MCCWYLDYLSWQTPHFSSIYLIHHGQSTISNGSTSWISSNCGCYTNSHHPFKYVVDRQTESIHHHFHLEIVQHTSFADYFPHPTLQLVAADLTCKTSFLTNINWLHLSIVLMQNLHDLTFWMKDYVIFYVHCIFR